LPLTLLCYGKCMHGNLASVVYNFSCEPTDAPQCVAFVVLAWLETEQDSTLFQRALAKNPRRPRRRPRPTGGRESVAAILLLDISLVMLGFQNPAAPPGARPRGPTLLRRL